MGSVKVLNDIHDSLKEGFLQTDQHFLQKAQDQEGFNGDSGSTAVVACIVGSRILCANIGDSRAVLCREGRAVQLSRDHKPDLKDEEERIKKAGGRVYKVEGGGVARVLYCGGLAVSRAFGDKDYKHPDPFVIAD